MRQQIVLFMTDKNKGGRPHTGRDKPITVKLSEESVQILSRQPNKSAFLDALIKDNSEGVTFPCPHCGKPVKLILDTKQ